MTNINFNMDGVKPPISVQDRIRLGQAFNCAIKQMPILSDDLEDTIKRFGTYDWDEKVKSMTKRFFKLLNELEHELQNGDF